MYTSQESAGHRNDKRKLESEEHLLGPTQHLALPSSRGWLILTTAFVSWCHYWSFFT